MPQPFSRRHYTSPCRREGVETCKISQQAKMRQRGAEFTSTDYAKDMGLPWLLALKAIPWDTILINAPAILRSADALLSHSKTRPLAPSETEVQALASRVTALEERNQATAESLTSLTSQVAVLTTAGKVLEARVRMLLVVTAVTALLVLAGGIAVFIR